MPSLSDLPNEIIILIAEGCDVRGKACLARSNRRLNGLATEVLLRYSVREEGNSAMYWAAEHGHINTLERMRACGAELNDSSGSRLPVVFRRLAAIMLDDIDVSRNFGFLPLHVAAQFGQDSAVHWLLKRGCRIESLAQDLCRCPTSLENEGFEGDSPPLWTSLHMAICRGNLSTAKLLISRGASLRASRDEQNFGGSSCNLLHTAARCDHPAAIEFLVGSGLVDVDEPDSEGHVALHYACSNLGNISAVKKLLDLGADVDIINDMDGHEPIYMACTQGFFEAATILLDKGLPFDCTHEASRGLLHRLPQPYQYFFRHRTLSTPAAGAGRSIWEAKREDFVRRLAQVGVGFLEWLGSQKPLSLIAKKRESLVRTLQVFLDVGADVNGRDATGKTALYYVLDGGNFDYVAASKVELLLRHGARLDVYAELGYCAFDRALAMCRSTGDASVIDFIFQHGSMANFGDGYLDRVVAHSYASHLFDECRLLTGHGATLKVPDEQLHANIRNGIDRKDLGQIDFHLDLFLDQIKPFDILDLALKRYKDGKEDEIETLKSLLARPELDSAEACAASRLLNLSCKYHANVAVARLLLDEGGEVNNFDSDWETPLSYAVDIGCRPMIRYLLLHGADPHLAPSDQDWNAHVSKSAPGKYPEHLAFGDTRYLTPFLRAISSHHAHPHGSCDTDANEKLACPLELMLEHKPLPPIPSDPESLSYVHYALAHPDSLRILLAKGADPNAGHHSTRPPLLHFLAIADDLRPAKPEAISVLLEFGADIHQADGQGRSFLTMMRRCTLAMANNALFDAELEHKKLGLAAGLMVRNFFITLDVKSGEDCVKPRPEAVADANYSEYLDRLAAYCDRKRQLEL